ncbi:GNAT family N-acetyltransferase [Nocardioides lijunqiniae]|uniref:GNAT family N-acetyltransferase n=1 Tax=Nocardioides lijunqiniae TaxID=2760832 RepID=UPI001877E093|nr:GNAT family N-acetyltransferase [Nocardioides lijunqiniae]
MSEESRVRPATRADLAGIKAIYDHQVLTSTSTFETTPPPLDYWTARLESTERGDHLLVAVEGERLLGYAYSASYRPRPAYARTRETSVYLAPEAAGRGLGRRLYDDLLAALRADDVHTVLAVVAQPNPASEALHRACGFEQVGLLPEVGFKLDRWIDTALWALRLD